MSTYKRTFSRRIDSLFAKEKWGEARRLIARELKSAPADHWLLTRLSTTYYEERKYGRALEIARRAAATAPHCPLVLWDEAGALDMLDRVEEAIQIYQNLIRRGERAIAHDECGEGMRWARALVTDCHCRLGLCYGRIRDYGAALRHFRRFQQRRAKGSGSIYGDADVERHLAYVSARARMVRDSVDEVEASSLQRNGTQVARNLGPRSTAWTLATLSGTPNEPIVMRYA
jgi:tetratricopeptide (TPR) repeat protein